MRLLYSIGIHFYRFLVFLASFFNPKARELYRGQKNALRYLKNNIEENARYVWFHAASLGEFEQGRPVMEALKRRYPNIKILLTFYSPSGYNVRKNYQGADVVSYLPPDTVRSAREFVKTVKPLKAIFIKYEFWPNFLLTLQTEAIPTYAVSAIFRPGQIFFKWYGKWYLQLLNTFRHLFVQDKESAFLLEKHGIYQVSISGDTRFDRVFALFSEAKKLPLIEAFVGGKPVIVAGSTWPEDEELLVRYLKHHPQVKLILVPHEIHKNHLEQIFKLLETNFIRYTEASEDNIANYNCLVVDTIGILSSIYQYAKIAYVGGGFGVGIHNILEAAVWNVPVVFGPNFQKFKEARDLIHLKGAFSISDFASLEENLDKLFTDSTAGQIAGDYVRRNIGATELICRNLEFTEQAKNADEEKALNQS
ncbi:glycosyltransferase N-terminal domain-containing protein [Porphyromonadaceae sp. NP-X]|nr:glycosyltransferase N-terminal domain-containing protein [Porphyromonadaceae sp. NP-X]